MEARWGPAVGFASHPSPGVPVPPIEENLQPLLIAVEGGQSLEQRRLIARDDDETARHVPGPQAARGKKKTRRQLSRRDVTPIRTAAQGQNPTAA